MNEQVRLEKTIVGESDPYEIIIIEPDGTERVEHPGGRDTGASD